MTPQELRGILETRGIRCRISKDEVKVGDCFFCGNEKYNLELNAESGVYRCWACKKGGAIETLLRQWFQMEVRIPIRFSEEKRKPHLLSTSVPIVPIAEIPSAVAYLRRRGLNEFLLHRYGIGICVEKSHRFYPRIIIPLLKYWTGTDGGVVGRDYVGKPPKYLADATSELVGWRQRNALAPHILVEGPFDGLSVHLAGFNAGVLLGKGEDEKLQMWAAQVPHNAPLVIMLDGEAIEEAQRMWWMAQTIRPDVRLIRLPAHLDPASIPPAQLRKFVEGELLKQSVPQYAARLTQ